MKETIVKISPQDMIRMKAVVMDEDRDAALEVVREFLCRAESQSRCGLRNHLDK